MVSGHNETAVVQRSDRVSIRILQVLVASAASFARGSFPAARTNRDRNPAAVVLPATGWLGRYFGRRRFLIACIALFTFASALCGMADSLGMLIMARILQGMGGGALQPVSQAVMLETFPQEKRGISMSIYSIGVIVAPILGPGLLAVVSLLLAPIIFLYRKSQPIAK